MSTFRRAAPPERPAEPSPDRNARSERPARPRADRPAPSYRAAPQSVASPAAAKTPKPRMRPRTVDRTKPATAAAGEGERLSKRVMQLKGCSRKEAEQFIEGGWVMVNGVVVEDPPFRVLHQTVTIPPDASLLNLHDITLILNKPAGWLDGVDEDDEDDDAPAAPTPARARGRKAAPKSARELLTHTNRCAHDDSGIRPLKRHLLHLEAEVPLETGASGLVVFTQDWRTTRKLTEDMGAMEHELIVDVKGEVQEEALQKIKRTINDERHPLPPTKVSVNSSSPELSKLRFAIKGAHPGLVAHLCERAGLEILAMRRIRLGRVTLSDLPVGQWRYLAAHEKF
jgi:23S rRNA pseudouridine2604 synthase